VSNSQKFPEPVALSIGSLSAATGVPVDTLRTWERRYGFPSPISRTEGSHRRYSMETVAIVQLIVRALALGHRPSAVIGRDRDELRQLIAMTATGEVGPQRPPRVHESRLQRWLQLSEGLEGDLLLSEFQAALSEMPALDFLERCMGPFLTAIGQWWAEGRLRVSQEHFASETAREFLSAQWRLHEAPRQPGQPAVVLGTPPGEYHVLGLHMAAWAVALGGALVVFLGADTPIPELVFAAQRYSARGVVLSVASGYREDLGGVVEELTSALPVGIQIVVGGAGSRRLGGDERKLNSLYELSQWAARLAGPDS
jgi:DNA-binding transcriptional MerR regulator/methylmalonyl-CoA mutase cobalamin-binding subunit